VGAAEDPTSTSGPIFRRGAEKPKETKSGQSRRCGAAQLPGAEEGYDAYGYNPSGEAATGFASGFEAAVGFEAAAAAPPGGAIEYAAADQFGAQY